MRVSHEISDTMMSMAHIIDDSMNRMVDSAYRFSDIMEDTFENSRMMSMVSPNLSTVGGYSNSSSVRNYNLNVSSQQASAQIQNDFAIMAVMA